MDLISRAAAIDAVRSYYDEFDTSDKSIEERIKALPSAQPNVPDTNVGDLISRQAAYEILERYDSTADVDAIRMDVEDLSSAQERKKRWIPCEEEFPPPNTAVLAYAPRFGNIWAVYYDSICGWMVWSPVGNVHFPNGQGEITAWMPLPEPYKGEEE